MEKRTCLECGEALRGRIDKKFCSDYCRNTYNNKVNKESKNFIRNINNRLRKNYKILSELNTTGKTKVSRATLYDKGYDFQFFTSVYKTKKGSVYYYVYNQGFLPLENDWFLLIKKEI
jgi:hypothetical protein